MAYSRNNNRGGRGGRFGGGRDGGRPSMHKTTCSDCSKSCSVPFKPTGSKPVFCSECFEGKEQGGGRRDRDRGGRGGSRGGRDRGGRGGDRRGRSDREMFEVVCDSCGDDCKVPFKPSSGKDVLCSPCFEKAGNGKSGANDKKMDIIVSKLDRILQILDGADIIDDSYEMIEEVVDETTNDSLAAALDLTPDSQEIEIKDDVKSEEAKEEAQSEEIQSEEAKEVAQVQEVKSDDSNESVKEDSIENKKPVEKKQGNGFSKLNIF
jgi:CxxC-x17-CxxC domain-containing protein